LIVAPGFPTRFALDLDEEKGERRNIVRALNADGRRDSAATAYSWEPTLDASQVRIVTRPGMRSIAALRQEAAVRGARGAAFAPTPSVPVRISRIPCR